MASDVSGKDDQFLLERGCGLLVALVLRLQVEKKKNIILKNIVIIINEQISKLNIIGRQFGQLNVDSNFVITLTKEKIQKFKLKPNEIH